MALHSRFRYFGRAALLGALLMLGSTAFAKPTGSKKVIRQVRGNATAGATAGTKGNVRNGSPTTAVVEGKAEAFAGARAKAEGNVGLGPFRVKAEGYVSAGAEAKASGTIGCDKGKLKSGTNAGAALGVGAGSKVVLEVDVNSLRSPSTNTGKKRSSRPLKKGLDADGNGKLGLSDAKRPAKKAP